MDWVDEGDNNGEWDLGEGEMWLDKGVDGCEDIYETGEIENPCKGEKNSDWSMAL